MPKGKGTYGSKRGRPPKKKNPIAGARKGMKRGVATGAGRAARGVAGAAMGIATRAKKTGSAKMAKRVGKATVGSMMKKRRKARTTKRSSYL